MKFSDLLAFAKAGYSAAEVKELLAIQPEENNAEPERDNASVESDQAESDAYNDEIKNRLAELEKQNAILQEQLKNAQQVNVQQNNSNGNAKSDEETLLDIFNNFN